MKGKEILFCNLTVLKNNKIVKIKDVVFKNVDGFYKGDKVIDIDIIKLLGYENLTTDFSEVKKSDEQRNTITGAYD